MLAGFWRSLTQAARVLFACRVSVLSALGGLFLFGLVLQAQNLFADLSFAGWAGGVLYWSGFFFAVFFVWAFPIHFGARKILSEDGWLVAPRLRRALSADELQSLQDRLRQEMAGLIVWLPRFLGVLPFVAIGLGLFFADRAMDGARALPVAGQAHRQILWLGGADFVFGALFIAFVYWRRPLIARMIRRFDRPEGSTRRHRASQDARLSTGRTQSLLDAFTVFSLGATALAFVVAYLWPHALATAIPRALLAPFMFGSLVLALSWLVRVGYRLGFPALTPILIACIAITATNRHFNDLRLLQVKSPAALDQRQIEVTEAVKRWRLANGCTGEDCPAALIVAAEGGASRAAFMEATLIGEIIDRTGGAPGAAPGRKIFAISGVSGGAFGGATIRAALADAADAGGAPPCKVAPRSWFGAGEADVDNMRASWRSCLQALVSGDYLSDGFIGLAFRDNLAPRQWFIGSKSWFDDRAALLEQSWERHYAYVAGGREALLQSGPACNEKSDKGMCRRFGYAKDAAEGGWLPLLLLNGTSVETGRRIIASDVVSTVEVEPGAWRRTLYPAAFDLFELLSTPCAANAAPCPRAPPFPGDQPRARDAPDLLLSTAALISARFPVISPAGVLRTPGGQDPPGGQAQGDRVVDGGYFENAGLTTALDLAAELKKLNVTPAILWVQNEPSRAGSTASTPPRPAATPFVGGLDESFLTRAFGVLASPADALFATREGHGAEAAALAVEELTSFNGWQKLGYYTIGVHETSQIGPAAGDDPSFERDCGALVGQLEGKPLAMTEVSMSWWLSATVQADLDAQICDSGNRSALNDLIGLLTKGK
jgi:hypothetical protein